MTQPANLLDLLDEVRACGWLVNNLFQLDDATWQANLRDETRCTQFGRGDTPEDALSAALDAMTLARPAAQPPAISSYASSETAKLSLSDLLAGMVPAPAPVSASIIRRF